MNKYFALRKTNRMRTELLTEKSQEQLKEVIRYLRRVSWDFCGIELVCSDLLDISIQANAKNQELFDSISDAKTFVEEVKPCLKTLRAADYFWFVAPLYFFFEWGVEGLLLYPVIGDWVFELSVGYLMQLDWSMWYLGQVKYCKMSEMTLSICNGVFNIGQLAAVGMIAKVVRKKSPDFALIFAGIGLCFCPVIMILVPHLPLAYRGVTFIVLMTVLNAPQCAVALCTVQILLNAAPEKNRSLLIGLFTMMTTLTNSVLPLLGVRLYTALGADLTALYRFNLIDLGVRILSTLGLIWRYQKAKKDGFLTKISD